MLFFGLFNPFFKGECLIIKTNKRLSSIRSRIMFLYTLITLLGFIFVLALSTNIVENFLVEQRVIEQQELLNTFADQLAKHLDADDIDGMYEFVKTNGQKYQARIIIVDANAVAQIDNDNSINNRNGQKINEPEVLSVVWNDDISFKYDFRTVYDDPNDINENQQYSFIRGLYNRFSPPKTTYAYYVSEINSTNNNVDFGNNTGFVGKPAIFMSVNTQDVFDKVEDIRFNIAIVMLIILVITLIFNYFAARSITNPIIELTSVIRKMSRGQLNQRVKIKGKSELSELGRAFNTMSEEIEHTEQFRSEFVSNASHEIKTPLATMKILIESLIYQEKLDENMAREFLGDINNEIDRLNSVITDLLRLVQIDQQEDRLNFEPVSLEDVSKGVIKRLTPIASKKNINIIADLSPISINADKVKIDQVIFNITDNAIKYSDENSNVYLTLSSQGQEAIIKIKDSGIGIPQKDISHIFDRFYRVDKARSRQTGGTGLGLSIVDKIIKMHNGNITVESEEDVGTTFIISLPFKQTKQ